MEQLLGGSVPSAGHRYVSGLEKSRSPSSIAAAGRRAGGRALGSQGLIHQQEQRGKANPSPGWAAVATTRRGKRGGADGDEEEEGVDESGRGRVGRVGRRRRRGIPSLPPPTKAVGPGAHEPYTWSPTRMGGGGDGGVDRGSRRGWAGRCCFTFTVYAQSSCFA